MQLTPDFALLGDALTFDAADTLCAQGIALIGETPGPITVDLAEINGANTLTVALLLAWYRAARLQEKSIVFVNLSGELRNIIAFSGLESLLPADDVAPDHTADHTSDQERLTDNSCKQRSPGA